VLQPRALGMDVGERPPAAAPPSSVGDPPKAILLKHVRPRVLGQLRWAEACFHHFRGEPGKCSRRCRAVNGPIARRGFGSATSRRRSSLGSGGSSEWGSGSRPASLNPAQGGIGLQGSWSKHQGQRGMVRRLQLLPPGPAHRRMPPLAAVEPNGGGFHRPGSTHHPPMLVSGCGKVKA